MSAPPPVPAGAPARAPAWLRLADRAALLGMGVGIALLLQPWWHAGFRWGFFVALGATVAQILTARLVAGRERRHG